jgi:uncharacterized membrane protein
MSKALKIIKSIFLSIRSLFFSGLVTIIPIAATLFFINFAYHFVQRNLEPLQRIFPSVLQKIPGANFIAVMLLIIGLGVLLKVFIAHTVIHYIEHLIKKIPLVRIVYSSAKILVNFFKAPDSKNIERKVVLITYPKHGQYHLAFLLESAEDSYRKIIPEKFSTRPGEKFYKVFMPNSPNVTSGYFFIMTEDEIIHTDITFEEAIKTLVSCGLTTPESLLQKYIPEDKR